MNSSIKEFARPINIASLCLGLLGVATGYYFWKYPAPKDKQLAYAVPPPSIVHREGFSTELSLFDSKNQAITESVVLIDVTITNHGSEELEPKDVRSPVRIIIPRAKKILSAKIVGGSGKTIDASALNNFKVGSASNNDNSSSAEVTWLHFDPGVSIDINILFVVNEWPEPRSPKDFVPLENISESVRLEGRIYGIDRFVNESEKFVGQTYKSFDTRRTISTMFLGAISALAGGFFADKLLKRRP